MIPRLKNLTNVASKHQGFRRYFSNTSWLFGEQFLRIIAGLLVGIYVARYLGPEQFGILNYALAFVALFGSLAKLGLDGIIVRDLVNAPNKRDIYLGTSFWLKFSGAIIAVALIVILALITESNQTSKIYIVIISCGLIFQSLEVVDFYFQSRVMSKYVSICKITQLIISSLLKLYFIAINANLFWFVLVSVIDQASLAVALAYAYSEQKRGSFYFHFDKAVAKELLISAKPLIISGIMVSVYSSIDRVIIKEMLGVREVGLYVAASGLVTALYFVPMIIANSLFPAIINAKLQTEDIYNRRISLLYKNTLSIGLIICVLASIFSDQIIIVFYGRKFLESAGVLQIYIWNLMPICFSAIFGKWLLSENLQYLMPRFTIMAISINLIGCFILIPLWSIKGAALAALAAQLIPLVWFSIKNKEIQSQLTCVFKIW